MPKCVHNSQTSVTPPQERAKYVRELGDLPVERDRLAAEQQLDGDIAGLERQVEYQAQDLAATRDRIQKMEAEAAALEKVRTCHL